MLLRSIYLVLLRKAQGEREKRKCERYQKQ